MSYRTALSEVLRTVIVPTVEATGARAKFPRASVTALGRAGLLGLTVSTEFGGLGTGLPEAAEVVARIARICPATAAVLQSHYAAVAVLESYGSAWIRGEIAAGRHLGSLALAEDDPAEQGVQGEFWASRSTAARSGDVVALRARKHQVVAAGEADSYVWSSRPLTAADGLTLWVVPAHAPDLFVPARPDGEGRTAALRPPCSPIRCWFLPTRCSAGTAEGSTSCCGRSCRGCSNSRRPSARRRSIRRWPMSHSGPPAAPPIPSRRPEPGRGAARTGPSSGWPRPRSACGRSRWCVRCACA